MTMTMMAVVAVVVGLSAAPASAKGRATHPPAKAAKAARTPKTPKTPKTVTSTSPAKLTESGRGVFWECSAKTTSLLIGVNRLTLHPGQVLNVNFIVRNGGTTACNYVAPYASAAPGPTLQSLQAGPCGSMGFEIEGAHHRNVWPGLAAFNCPALGFAQLAPGAAVAGSGSWSQTLPTGLKRVPAGTYNLVVDGHFDFPLKIEAN